MGEVIDMNYKKLLATQIVEKNKDIKAALVIGVDQENQLQFHHHEMSYEQCLQNMTLLRKWILEQMEKM